MNKEQARGTLKHFVGTVQVQLGRMIGSQEQQINGIRRQASGMAEKRIGDVQGLIVQASALAKGVSSRRRA